MGSVTFANGCFTSLMAARLKTKTRENDSNFQRNSFCNFITSPKTYNSHSSRIRSSSSSSGSGVGEKAGRRSDDKSSKMMDVVGSGVGQKAGRRSDDKSSKVMDVVGSGVGEKAGRRSDDKSSKMMDDYNTAMKRMMRNPYEYHHDLGMNYTHITDNLIVGSQPQKPEDIDHLKQEENVAYILNLQQDEDIEYWGIDLQSITKRCQELGIRHMRMPARDFDPDSLRNGLPTAVSSLEWAISEGKGRVYIHCTAGLGRAPAVAIAYLFWFHDMDLNTAYNTLTSKRPCGPNKRAIRGATYDLAKNDPWKEPFESLPEHAFGNVADWERKLIQDRVHALRGT